MTTILLKHAAVVSVSNVDKKSNDDELPVQVLNYTDVYYGDRLGPSSNLKRATVTPQQLAKFKVRHGDVLITKDSETADDIGVPAFVDAIAPDLVCGYHLAMLRPRTGTDGRYLFWTMTSDLVRRQLETLATGVTRFGLRTDAIGGVEFPLPPLGEQRAIADYLDTETARIDALITKKRHLITLLEEAWSAEVVERTLGNPGSVALRRLVIPPVGGTWGAVSGERSIEATCVRGADFNTDTMTVARSTAPVRSFDPSDYLSKSLNSGDLIIEKSGGGDNQPVGRVVQWTGKDRAVPTNFAARLRPGDEVHSRWLCYVLRGAYEAGLTRAWIKQTTGIQNLDLGGFLSEKVLVPTKAEQRSIASSLDDRTVMAGKTRSALYGQLDLLVEHRQALITAAVTGELRVPGVAV